MGSTVSGCGPDSGLVGAELRVSLQQSQRGQHCHLLSKIGTHKLTIRTVTMRCNHKKKIKFFATCGVQADHWRAATVRPLSRPVNTGHAESDGALRW